MKLVFFLTFAAFLAAAQNSASNGKAAGRHALLIANSQYVQLPPLQSPKANADALKAVLSKANFEIQSEYDLPFDGMLPAIRKFAAAIQPGDIALIYFSGYGFQDDINYLLPVNFDPKDDTSTGQKAVSVLFIETQLSLRNAGTRMLIFDASRPCPSLISEGLALMQPAANTLVAFAAGPNQSAPDPPDGGVNLFTAALIDAIQEPGSKPAGMLEHAQSEVANASKRAQTPYVQLAPVDDFYFTNPLPVVVAEAPKPVVKVVEVDRKIKAGDTKENPKDRLTYVWIPGATFKMGCVHNDDQCEKDEKPQHEVKIGADFWITRTEVTAGAYDRCVKATVCREAGKTQTRTDQGTELPATKISWDDAKTYCGWAGGVLPTEAEWEYAARGGKPDLIYPWGNQITPTMANYAKSEHKKPFFETVPVGRIDNPNGFGLFDIAGNVREWTADFYDAAAYSASAPATGKERVVRGGSFNTSAKDLRVSARDKVDTAKFDKGDNQTGFRCVAATLGGSN